MDCLFGNADVEKWEIMEANNIAEHHLIYGWYMVMASLAIWAEQDYFQFMLL